MICQCRRGTGKLTEYAEGLVKQDQFVLHRCRGMGLGEGLSWK